MKRYRYDSAALRDLVARRQMSVAQLAKKAGIARITAYRAMDGEIAHVKTLGKIAKALEVAPNYLLAETRADGGGFIKLKDDEYPEMPF